MRSIEVVGLGALNMDYICQVEHILEVGEAAVAKNSISSPGGSAANTIYGLSKLGVKTGALGVLGDDTEGGVMQQDFKKVGVDTSRLRVKVNARTGSVLYLSDKLGRHSIYVSPGVNNLLTMDDIDLTYINQAGMIHLSPFADDRQFEVLLELVGRLDSSTMVSFAPGTLHGRKKLEALAPILARTQVLFINHHEMRQLIGEDVIAGAETCLRQGCRIVVVTLGRGMKMKLGRGATYKKVTALAYIRAAQDEYVVEEDDWITVSEVDNIGAGDAFAAGFIYGLLREKSLDECGYIGNITAQFSISKLGARQGLPALDELFRRYRELYSREL